MEPFTTLTILLIGMGAFYLVSRKVFPLVSPKKLALANQILSAQTSESELLPELDIENSHELILGQFNELEITRRIYETLVVEEIYKEQGLTVGEFAKKLGVQARVVTQLTEKLYGHSFKELTNMYRVEYAKERIEEGYLDLFTLDALGKEAGFSSRITFFNVFKKEIGICPSEYWKNYLNEVV